MSPVVRGPWTRGDQVGKGAPGHRPAGQTFTDWDRLRSGVGVSQTYQPQVKHLGRRRKHSTNRKVIGGKLRAPIQRPSKYDSYVAVGAGPHRNHATFATFLCCADIMASAWVFNLAVVIKAFFVYCKVVKEKEYSSFLNR